MKIKQLATILVLVSFGFGAQVAQAIPNLGFSNVTKVGDVYTFTFDTRTGDQPLQDRDGSTDGLSFTSGDGLNLLATGSGIVRQDWPANGGLGILGDGCGNLIFTCTDNIEGDEFIRLAFNMAVDLVDFSLNGMIGQNGHQASANGPVKYGTNKSGYTAFGADANIWDDEGSDLCPPCNFAPAFEEFTTFGLSPGGTSEIEGFEGYIESISVRISGGDVPEPSVIALFAAGLIGIGFARRRKA